MKRTKKNSFFKKVLVVLMALALIGGTFAWQDFTQRAFNPLRDSQDPVMEDINQGFRVHNDYEINVDMLEEGFSEHNKNIYIENFSDDYMFVRMRVYEHMEVAGRPVLATSDITNPDTWSVYNAMATDATARRTGAAAINAPGSPAAFMDVFGTGIEWFFAGPASAEKYFMPTFNQVTGFDPNSMVLAPAPFQAATMFRAPDATGDGIAAEVITGNPEWNEASIIDIHSFFEGAQTGIGTDGLFGSASASPNDGSRNFWGTGDTVTATLYTFNAVTGNIEGSVAPVTHTAQPTIEAQEDVMTMAEFFDPAGNDGEPGDFWVLDTEASAAPSNGVGQQQAAWFYWANPLPAGEATAMLLEEIALTVETAGVVDYVTHVVGEGVTLDYIADIAGSEDAENLLNRAAETIYTELYIPDNIGIGDNFTYNGVVWRVLARDANGNLLIITEHLHGPWSMYYMQLAFTIFETSILKTNMNNWYNTNTHGRGAGPGIRNIALNYEFRTEAGAPIARNLTGAGIEVDWTVNNWRGGLAWTAYRNLNLPRARTVAGTPATATDRPAFALSISEANHYFGGSTGVFHNPERIAQCAHTGMSHPWALRSPGFGPVDNGDHRCIMIVYGYGAIGTVRDNPLPFRPALWINPNL